ncbi:DUF7192 family protein [Amycolatopsis sp. CA-230715]|uniref:DUF7192 family protein n=1 Tax=Amycolatopsis sp. CA-230715 TaxID=2745196 RepID=UPI001C019940|nr:hypothetical protein [Amycolatopsis sp. CA-230715]QWF78884.1 hypothetical protein HUW46_02283 [Amycolatopsis sp. CA-230715]
MHPLKLPPLSEWQDFLDAATTEPSIDNGASRRVDAEWQKASWDEALRLAVDGWPVPLEDTHVTVGELRERAGLTHPVTMLEPVWDTTGAEVDVGAYLAGVPECMVDAVPRRVSRRGKVVTFLVPAGYSHFIEHDVIINRGLALATLCAAIIDAGHSVEVWSGDAGFLELSGDKHRYSGVARVLAAGEPLDLGRLIFAVAHPSMLRRLWFGVWDAQPAAVAGAMVDNAYGVPPFTCLAEDLPAEITDPYVFPYLTAEDRQWDDLPTALSWSTAMFADLGLIQAVS